MSYCKSYCSIFLFLFLCSASYAQHETVATGEEHSMKGVSRLTLGLGHTHVSEGQRDGKTQWLALASWSLNYDYWVSNKLAIGLQNDVILESFIIEDHENELIERYYPVSVVPVAIFKPGKHVSIIGGVGVEISKDQTLALTRVGLEYGFDLLKQWEVGAAIVNDRKWRYYNSWGLAFTVSKLWSAKKKH
jgi:hypothetical protein